MKNKYITYYELLGVEPTATTEEIIKAFKKKSLEYHPDKNNDNSTSTVLFQYILDAKNVLTDPQKREEYDYLIGVKKKPEPAQKVVYKTKTVEKKRDIVTPLVVTGAVGLIVGLFLGGSGKGK